MKTSFIKFLGAVALMAGLASSASAAYIQGSIFFSGKVAVDTSSSNATAATKITSWKALGSGSGLTNKLSVTDASGDFTPVLTNPFSLAAFTSPWVFTSTNIPNFWSVGGFSFDLSSATKSVAGSGFVVDAVGFLKGTGFENTPGSFSISVSGNKIDGRFNASADSTAVPEGGAAIALLGLSLLGLEGARRRLKA